MATVFVDSNASGANDGSSWTDAYELLYTALTSEADGQDYLMEYRHIENHSLSAREWPFSNTVGSPDSLISVDKDNSDAYRRGAYLDLNDDSYGLRVDGQLIAMGINYEVGDGGSHWNTDMGIATNDNDEQIHIDCIFRIHNTSNSGVFFIGESNTKVTFYNVDVTFAGDSYIQIYACDFRWFGGASICENASDINEFLFLPIVEPAIAHIEGVDFSTWDTDVNIHANSSGSCKWNLLRCKMPAGWVGDLAEALPLETFNEVVMESCGDSDVNYTYQHLTPEGEMFHQVDLYPAGTVGAKHNAADVPLSLKMVTNANVLSRLRPLHTPMVSISNEDTTSQTISWEFIHNDAALLQNDDIWLQLSYLATANKQVSTNIDGSNMDIYGSFDPYATPANVAASTKAWDEGLTARANSTIYAVGDIRKESGSAGSAFRCTAIVSDATSSGSVPAGFTSASDGDSITDGNVTWEAMYRQKAQLTITAAEQGTVRVQLLLNKASTTIWASMEVEQV